MVLDLAMFAPPETFAHSSIHPPITTDGAKAPTQNPPHPSTTIHQQPSTINQPQSTLTSVIPFNLPTPKSTKHTKHTLTQKTKNTKKVKKRKERKNKKPHKKYLPATHYPLPSQPAHAQRRYIRHNLGRIMRISQQTLQRLGIPRVRSSRRYVRATVRFRLHPSGAISGLRLSRRSGLRAIDRRTLQVIRAAHRRYPRPKVPVQVQITMRYGL